MKRQFKERATLEFSFNSAYIYVGKFGDIALQELSSYLHTYADWTTTFFCGLTCISQQVYGQFINLPKWLRGLLIRKFDSLNSGLNIGPYRQLWLLTFWCRTCNIMDNNYLVSLIMLNVWTGIFLIRNIAFKENIVSRDLHTKAEVLDAHRLEFKYILTTGYIHGEVGQGK